MSVEPRATYRIQLNPEFTFDDAAHIVEYLADLGISHLYCSPCMQAAPGSMHGYDVVDHSRLNAELGGRESHQRLCRTLENSAMGQLLDIVPNHMAITGPENRWWWDVLENGPAGRYASYFDVDWEPPEASYRNKVLLPVLGDHYGRILEAGELTLRHQQGSFTLHYYEHMFPVSPRSLAPILAAAAERCHSDELGFIAGAFSRLPSATATDRASVQRRHRDKQVLHAQLQRLCREQPEVNAAIERMISEVNSNYDDLDELIGRQNYRVAFWHTAEHELGYRRFFNINSLVGLHAEDEQVFADTHHLIRRLVAQGFIDGLRIDHPDGLYDPQTYFHHLQRACPGTWLVVEKILGSRERLRYSWPVDGTTGYDFLNIVNGVFVDPAGEDQLQAAWSQFSGKHADYQAIVRASKHLVMEQILGSDLNRLTTELLEICQHHRRYRDYTRYQLQHALQEIVACFPVYRTYIQAHRGRINSEDIQAIEHAIQFSKTHHPEEDHDLCDFLRNVLLLRLRGETENEFVMRFQQFTAPVMAKAVEDTVFYLYTPLVSLNEVGGEPRRFGVPVETFHRHCADIGQNWPKTLLATSTHDTKRSEDVRARLNILSEIPAQWTEAVQQWSTLNQRHKRHGFPDPNAEYLLYQTLVGAWPIEEDRVLAYMEKAACEAKEYTSWTKPDQEYEKALQNFVKAIFQEQDFLDVLEAFVAPLIDPARINSLAQTLLKLTAPGVPDIYQGTELWDLSLVDPDNRRPVDYTLRRRLLAELNHLAPEHILNRMDEGLPKLWIIRQTLNLRKQHPEFFGPASAYQPLSAQGPHAHHVVAFMRADSVITLVPRLIMGLHGDWDKTAIDLPEGPWHNELTHEELQGGPIRLARLFAQFPVGLLSKKTES